MESAGESAARAIGSIWPDTRRPRVSSSADGAALTRMLHCPQVQQAVQTLRSRNGSLREVSADLCQLAVTSSRRRSVRALSHIAIRNLKSPCEDGDLTWRPAADLLHGHCTIARRCWS
jgi:hypothetical protein